MAFKEPYWARYVKSWRNPTFKRPEIKTKKLQHCKACTWNCDFTGSSEFVKRNNCPYYNLQ